MTDANGLYYMRARYYDPDIKRFVNADTYKGELSLSATLNNYTYTYMEGEIMAIDNIRGVLFRREVWNQNCLAIILNCINMTDYEWELSYYEEPGNDKLNDFDWGPISGVELYHEIKNSYGNVIHAEIEGFKSGCEMADIDNYNDYLSSSCEIAIFCTDSRYYEIYCKSINQTDLIMQTLNKNQLGKTEYISDSNDGRTAFRIW